MSTAKSAWKRNKEASHRRGKRAAVRAGWVTCSKCTEVDGSVVLCDLHKS